MIPDNKIRRTSTFPEMKYICLSDLNEFHTPEEVEEFGKWFEGQTGMGYEGKLVYYANDYLRWRKIKYGE